MARGLHEESWCSVRINYGINRRVRRGSVMAWQHENHHFEAKALPTTAQMLKRVRVHHSGWNLTGFAPTGKPDHAPNRKGNANRIRIGGCGPYVDKTTLASLAAWQARAAHASKSVSLGVMIDRLVGHAERTDFNPITDAF